MYTQPFEWIERIWVYGHINSCSCRVIRGIPRDTLQQHLTMYTDATYTVARGVVFWWCLFFLLVINVICGRYTQKPNFNSSATHFVILSKARTPTGYAPCRKRGRRILCRVDTFSLRLIDSSKRTYQVDIARGLMALLVGLSSAI